MNEKPQFIENDRLVREWNARLELISQNDDRFEVENELRENRHVQGRLDTIKTLSYDDTMLRFHTTKDLYAVESAEIEDTGFPLQESVEVGMTKSELEEVLDTELTSDYIRVGNKPETFVFSFTFKNNRLEKISFDGYVD